MKLDFREICKTLFLCIASVNLGVSSGLVLAGIVFAVLFLYLHVKKMVSGPTVRVPRYKKSIAYLGLVPCIIWWVLSPSADYGVSPFVVFIPAWYLLFLAWLQKRSVGNGAYEVFVVFDGVAVLVLGLFHAPKFVLLCGVVALLLVVCAYRRPRTALYKHLAFALLFVSFGGASLAGWHYWKSHRHYGGHWARDYYERNRVMGFDPVAALGSFNSNYTSRYNDQVILRVWDSLAPEYLRAAVYEKYVAGIWKLPHRPEQKIYPAYYQVDYAVFESADSVTRRPGVKSVWVQAALDNFGFMFSAPNAVGVAAKNADSLDYYSANVYAGANGHRGDWYYFVPDGTSGGPGGGIPDSFDLHISPKYRAFVDSVAQAMSLSPEDPFTTMAQYYLENFMYSLEIDGVSRGHRSLAASGRKDPLAAFWKSRKGYCEYFATLSVLLLRHEGIPARYVTGFAHPERPEGASYAFFRRRHSHAWVEAFVDGHWMSFDPTPPIFVVQKPEVNWFQTMFERGRAHASLWFHYLRDGEWRQSVDRWQSLSERLLSSPVFYGFWIVVLAVFLLFKWKKNRSVFRRHQETRLAAERWILLLDKTEKKLVRYGFVRNPGETVRAFSHRLEKAPQDIHVESLVMKLKEYEKNRWRL